MRDARSSAGCEATTASRASKKSSKIQGMLLRIIIIIIIQREVISTIPSMILKQKMISILQIIAWIDLLLEDILLHDLKVLAVIIIMIEQQQLVHLLHLHNNEKLQQLHSIAINSTETRPFPQQKQQHQQRRNRRIQRRKLVNTPFSAFKHSKRNRLVVMAT